MSMGSGGTTYDEVPYQGLAYAQTHPDRLATIATILGMRPASPARCRVLEVGCGDGGNIIPMAAALPGSQFVGVDLSQVQIADGQSIIAELGLSNLTLLQGDILAIGDQLGQFDYIIAHGVYSWVPAAVRDALLALCGRCLTPDGVAYISYNAYPGWHLFDPLRNLMRRATAGARSPAERIRQAQELLDLLSERDHAPGSPMLGVSAYNLRERLKGATAEGLTSILIHDIMEENNQPVYFTEFVEHAARHGLQYLAEANFPLVLPRGISDEATSWIRRHATSGIEVELYMDFFRDRTFRQTLLCRSDLTIARALRPERVGQLAARSQAAPEHDPPDLAPGVVERFQGPDGSEMAIDTPVSKAAMLALREAYPDARTVDQLLARALEILGEQPGPDALPALRARLCADLLTAYTYSIDLLNLLVCPPAFAAQIGERPAIAPLARLQVRLGRPITSPQHRNIAIAAHAQPLIGLIDGTRDIAALEAEAAALGPPPPGDPDAAEDAPWTPQRAVRTLLEWARAHGLLVGP